MTPVVSDEAGRAARSPCRIKQVSATKAQGVEIVLDLNAQVHDETVPRHGELPAPEWIVKKAKGSRSERPIEARDPFQDTPMKCHIGTDQS